ncbi:hypothetical protein C2G38_2156723 [Gigaspora rosea]|uniref:Uncharacterized protein n=1 Tax=Gigaspora rosea TaxID=44941 RepID=A0A397WAY4_9GLOM|nr:hypothetical protein C2G38_2156723 [Gigaspora rosea]
MSSKITQVFCRTVFPTHFAAHRVHCFQLPKPYLSLSRTLKFWNDLNQENKDLSQKNELLKKQLEKLHKYQYYDLLYEGQETNVLLLDIILRGEFVALYSARASGKSTRMFQVMEKLRNQGIIAFNDVKSADDFKLKFRKEQWNDKQVVLFIDEYDELFKVHDDIKSSFLGTIRAIKNAKDYYALLDPFRNPNFTLEQVQTVYKEFENDSKIDH